MHVLTLTPFYPSAGNDASGCFVAEPLARLSQFGVESTVIAAQPWYRKRLLANPEPPPAAWIRYFAMPYGLGLPSAGNFLSAKLLPTVRELHRVRPIDLIHAHGALPCGHAASVLCRRLKIPFVVTVHGFDAFMTNQVPGIRGQWCKRVSRQVYVSAGQVICISEKVRERVLAGVLVPTSVVYNGVDQEMFSSGPSQTETSGLLAVGNLIPIKGHDLLLRALAALNLGHSSFSCEFIGEGPERDRLRALTVSLGIADRVRFLGRQTRAQVAEAMRRCSVFALPSRYEGLGCVYLEAMSSGKPVIACSGQGIEEIIRHGVNGWLIESGSLSQLITALKTLMSDSQVRSQIGDAARATIVGGFTLTHQAGVLAQLYRKCASF
jgi:teichuronic acid biosynthesis glycosyltransferase TuaC